MNIKRYSLLAVTALALLLSGCSGSTPYTAGSPKQSPPATVDMTLKTMPSTPGGVADIGAYPVSRAVCFTPGDIPGLVVYFEATQGEGTVTTTVFREDGKELEETEQVAYFGRGDGKSRHVEILGDFGTGLLDVEIIGNDGSKVDVSIYVPSNPCLTSS